MISKNHYHTKQKINLPSGVSSLDAETGTYSERYTQMGNIYELKDVTADTPTAKARWVLIYIHFQIYSKAYETNEIL